LKYLTGLVEQIEAQGGRLFSDSPVMEVEEREHDVRVKQDGGMIVTAGHSVFATNSPTSDWVEIHSKMAPYRTYAMAFTIPRGALPDALYWDMADPYHYVRIQPGRGSTDYLIAGGADHKSGEADDGAIRFEAIEAWIRELIPTLGREVTRWSGQVLDTIDYCGFIGRDPNRKRTFIATGVSGQGMTHGALAGMRIKNFAEYLMPAEIESAEALKPGEGGIMRDGASKIAVCRDSDGTLHARSAVCTHLGCHVHWNSTEQCWDCPCHGSQFAPNGAVLSGPAIAPLPEAKIASRKRAGAKVVG
jgi:glycine/D-amino acid oxidase-like deaminating enzyme